MAYLRSIVHTCRHPGCSSRATVEVVNAWNAMLGDYCTKHGKQHLAAQQRLEEASYDRSRAAPNVESSPKEG